jgi:mannose-1-phosphate guanylyltransferase/phosphomannomutase
VVELYDQGRVVRFQEKPGPGRAFSNLANTGIYCVEPRVLERIPRGQAFDWSRDVFPRMLADGLPLCGHGLDGYWCDIGSIKDYRRGQWDALAGAVRVTLPGAPASPGVRIGANARIDPGAVVEGPALLGAGCRLERGARVLPGGAFVANAVLGTGCEVGPGAVVRDCVVGEETRIGADCWVHEEAVLGRGCRLTGSVRIGAAQRVEPQQLLAGAEAPHRPHARVLPHGAAQRATAGVS